MTEVIYGTMYIPGKVDITDPSYNKDVWCRVNNFPIPSGEYECYAQIKNSDETGGWGERVSRIGIRRDKADMYEYKTNIGVDAGLAGFFIDKPDYTDEQWIDFCHKLNYDELVYLDERGFFSSSGYGDGEYDVIAGYKNGEIVELYIDFI